MKPVQHISIKEYGYDLPDEKIAKYPLTQRDKSKLLHYKDGVIEDSNFRHILKYIPKKSILFFNNTKVIQARIMMQKATGANIEIFCLEPIQPNDFAQSFVQNETCTWKCIVGNARKWKDSALEKVLKINDEEVIFYANKIKQDHDSVLIEFSWSNPLYSFSEVLEAAGNMPIPPYLNRESEEVDTERYQTVFSKFEGSVAAPTASLHFTPENIEYLQKNRVRTEEVTLHVGAGTFKPVKAETIGGHKMHTEHFYISQKAIRKLIETPNVIAVGTTTVRTLESLYWLGAKVKQSPSIEPENLYVSQWDPYEKSYKDTPADEALQILLAYMRFHRIKTLWSRTDIIIAPGYKFKFVDAMFTNFHQPESTLLLLVSAFVGDKWKEIYEHALQNNYRFLSYGDSSLLFGKEKAEIIHTEPQKKHKK